MNPHVLSWPVCGRCCEVAWFPWLGGPHHCVVAECEEPAPAAVVSASSSHTDDLHLLLEVLIEEAIDEVVAGPDARLDVTLFTDGRVQLRGRGLSSDGRCAQTLLGAQAVFVGQQVDVRRDGWLRFWPDPAIFGTATIDATVAMRCVQGLVFITAGMAAATVVDERNSKVRTFQHGGGLPDYVRRINRTRTALHADVVHFCDRSAGTEADVALQWNVGFSPQVHVYVNGSNADGAGPYAEDFDAALVGVVNAYARRHCLLRITEADLPGDAVRAGVTAVLSVRTTDQGRVRALIEKHLAEWFTANPADARTILDWMISSWDARRRSRRSHCRG